MTKENHWLLVGARVALNARSARELDIEIKAGKIRALAAPGTLRNGGPKIELRGCLILPGLINAHDHLDLNLFPRLGRGPYPNAGAWARDIYHPDRSPVREHLRVPLELRLRWGGIKNLLSGVTTVSHHNPYDVGTFERSFPVRVQRRLGWAHSLEFSPNLRTLHRQTPPDWPFITHIAESIDDEGELEVFKLKAMKALDARTVLVHGVALNGPGLRLVKRAGASLVWCPSSNLFILGRTLSRAALNCGIPVALGTDSALSAAGDMLDELKVALQSRAVTHARIYRMATEDGARVLRLSHGEGKIAEGSLADLIIIRDSDATPAQALTRLQTGEMEMAMVGGRVHLASLPMASLLPSVARSELQPAIIEGRMRVLVKADIRGLYRRTSKILGKNFCVAGKRIESYS